LLGLGVVGAGTWKVLKDNAEEIARRAGRRIEIIAVAVRNVEKARGLVGDDILVTTDGLEVARHPDIDIVVELIGGDTLAREWVLEAIAQSKHVVTANKALLALHGNEIFSAAREKSVMVAFEAAVAGGIPIVKAMREGLAANHIESVAGIINGTTNFILSEMRARGLSFTEVLAEAQRLGYAEADPTADVEGFDAAAKAAILSSLAFHSRVSSADVHREGITEVSARDIAAAQEMDCTVKLLAICERVVGADGREGISARVHPALIPLSHPLASVRGAYNAVFVEAEGAGDLMFYGQGAGGDPTASAVLGDLVAVARARVTGGRGPGESTYADLPVLPMGQAITRYHVSLDVADRSGVLASVATVFANHDVSIETVRQQVVTDDDGESRAMLIIVTHAATDAALSATVNELAELDTVNEVTSVMRVEGN
jgi:homoserine dehydrogenase